MILPYDTQYRYIFSYCFFFSSFCFKLFVMLCVFWNMIIDTVSLSNGQFGISRRRKWLQLVYNYTAQHSTQCLSVSFQHLDMITPQFNQLPMVFRRTRAAIAVGVVVIQTQMDCYVCPGFGAYSSTRLVGFSCFFFFTSVINYICFHFFCCTHFIFMLNVDSCIIRS